MAVRDEITTSLRERLHTALDAFLDALDEYRRAPAADEFVKVASLPFEAKARADLVRQGLRTVQIGRERWTKRSWVAELIDTMPAVAPRKREDDLASVIALSAKRRAG